LLGIRKFSKARSFQKTGSADENYSQRNGWNKRFLDEDDSSFGRTFSVRIKQTFDPADLQGKNKSFSPFSEKGLLSAYFFKRGCSIALEFPIDIGL
jgi:hypothetical protein